MSAIHLIIHGEVQGVFFRAETLQKAQELGITGWVRNCENGTVEIHAEGSGETLKQLEEWCHKGPPAAKVYSIKSTSITEEGCDSFKMAR